MKKFIEIILWIIFVLFGCYLGRVSPTDYQYLIGYLFGCFATASLSFII